MRPNAYIVLHILPRIAYLIPAMRLQTTCHDLDQAPPFVEEAGDSLATLSFGEYLVESKAISRENLLQALQIQDMYPNLRVGECLTKIGVLDFPELCEYLMQWCSLHVVPVE